MKFKLMQYQKHADLLQTSYPGIFELSLPGINFIGKEK
jgi:hypothetical protein